MVFSLFSLSHQSGPFQQPNCSQVLVTRARHSPTPLVQRWSGHGVWCCICPLGSGGWAWLCMGTVLWLWPHPPHSGPTLCPHTQARQSSSVQSLSHIRLFVTPWTVAHQASLSISNSWSLLKLMSTELVMPSNHLILCRPLLLLPSIFHNIRVFSKESVLHIRWPKYWSFSFSISPSNEYSGLISFRMDWLDLLAIQGTLKSLLQHSSKALILWRSTIFIVQLSHPYMTTGKTIALTIQTFVSKVMSLLFNMLSRLVIAFLPRSKRLLISGLQSPSAVILELRPNRVSVKSPSCPGPLALCYSKWQHPGLPRWLSGKEAAC